MQGADQVQGEELKDSHCHKSSNAPVLPSIFTTLTSLKYGFPIRGMPMLGVCHSLKTLWLDGPPIALKDTGCQQFFFLRFFEWSDCHHFWSWSSDESVFYAFAISITWDAIGTPILIGLEPKKHQVLFLIWAPVRCKDPYEIWVLVWIYWNNGLEWNGKIFFYVATSSRTYKALTMMMIYRATNGCTSTEISLNLWSIRHALRTGQISYLNKVDGVLVWLIAVSPA